MLVHQFDELGDQQQPWLPCPLDSWCGKFSDRIATSIINIRARVMYCGGGRPPCNMGAVGGIVLPPVARILCAYAQDGNSMHPDKTCIGRGNPECIPGCSKAQECHSGQIWSCGFPPGRLKDALRAQEGDQSMLARNNELVMDAKEYVRLLPFSVEAFFYNLDSAQWERDNVRNARDAFIREYHLDGIRAPPLLRLDLQGGGGSPWSVG